MTVSPGDGFLLVIIVTLACAQEWTVLSTFLCAVLLIAIVQAEIRTYRKRQRHDTD